VPSAVVITEGKRLLFVLPWGDRVIIGTTDTDYRGAPEEVAVAPEDVRYVLRTVNEFFPRIALHESDLISSWAGLRPLIANPDGSPSDISRAHQIKSPQPGWWDIAGGKLTTYRLMAEQAVDQVVRHLRISAPPCRTAQEPLLRPEDITPYSGIHPAPFTREAVAHYIRHEWALRLEDVFQRRSGWEYQERPSSSTDALVAGWMAEAAGWSAERLEAEMRAFRARPQHMPAA
jgi:glycerol-3-phosphate dehydrogenase